MSLPNEVMDTEELESRKRPLDRDDESGINKRSTNYGSGDDSFHLKLMIPTSAAGAIIGKGGETIGRLQKELEARVKMAKNNDFYPGTQERVCILMGSMRSVLELCKFFVEKIREKTDPGRKVDVYDYKSADRGRELKLLVTNTTAGMVIGKQGSYIKEIKETTGAYVQVSPKSAEALPERVVTVIGEPDQLVGAAKLILLKMSNDASAKTFTNVSYGDVPVVRKDEGYVFNNPTNALGQVAEIFSQQSHQNPFQRQPGGANGSLPAANFQFEGPNSAHNNSNQQPQQGGLFQSASPFINGPLAPPVLNDSLNSQGSSSNGTSGLLQFLENLQASLRTAGYNELALAEIMSALQILAKYNVLGLAFGLGLPNTPGAAGLNNGPVTSAGPGMGQGMGLFGNSVGAEKPQVNGTNVRSQAAFSSNAGSYQMSSSQQQGYGSIPEPGYVSARTSKDAAMADEYGVCGASVQQQDAYTEMVRQLIGAEGTVMCEGGLERLDVEIAEHIVGAVLGLQGRRLLEIQAKSGAKVEVSKKGDFVPGTQNRIVSITGIHEAVKVARFLVEKAVVEEQGRRSARGQMGNR